MRTSKRVVHFFPLVHLTFSLLQFLLLSIEYLIDICVRVYLARIIPTIFIRVFEAKKKYTIAAPYEIENARTILIACKIYNLSDMLKRKLLSIFITFEIYNEHCFFLSIVFL